LRLAGERSAQALQWRPGWAAVPISFCLIMYAVTGLAGNAAIDEARELIELRKDDQALELLLQAIEQNRQDHEAHFLLAKVFLRRQDHDMAKKHAERAVTLNDSISDYHFWLARAYLAKAMESGLINSFLYARRGKKEYDKAVALDSSNVEARLELCMYLVTAPGIVGGDREKGRVQAHIVEQQDSLYGAYAWANVSERDGDLARAEHFLRKAVKSDTSEAFYARYALGYFYERHERYDEAVEVFKGILADKPDEMIAVFQVGKICVITESDLDEAEACFKRYLEVESPRNAPDWASAHWRLGLVYDLQGKPDLALAELHKAVELAPQNKEFKRSLKEIEKKTKK
jgi:tetratricopeptide (TPR) repeat protein